MNKKSLKDKTSLIVLEKPVLSVSRLKLLICSTIFVILDVSLPSLAHQFHLAGPTFLPLHFFVFVAGLLLGWQAGILVGLLSPLISFLNSGLPPALLLPQITLELLVYGTVVGWLRERYKLNLWLSLLTAMTFGRLARGAMVLPNSGVIEAFSLIFQVTKQGLPGILLQLVLIPPLVKILRRLHDFHPNI